MAMFVYTGDETTLNEINGTNINGWAIEVITDGANVPFINEETINNPIFADLQPKFNKLTQIEYTPYGE